MTWMSRASAQRRCCNFERTTYTQCTQYIKINQHFCMVSRMKMTMMSNDLVLVRTPAPIIRHMVSLFPPRCYTAHTALALYSVFCWLCDPCNISQYNEVQSSCISSTKDTYNHIYYILRKICRGSDCQVQKCVPTIKQLLHPIHHQRKNREKKLPKFSIVSAITESNDRVDAAFAQELTDQSW